jgi:hypothetical protein
MGKTYEYKFVRLGESRSSDLFGVHDKARTTYQAVEHEHRGRLARAKRGVVSAG